eukprot:GHVR01059513.1.p1 GENE.GHVR01059513.1~~GHVR01059513.1.p1  ORF type:complete len:264 (-),score=56.67 GHVR01059513.1:13-804(-)
MLFRLGGVCIVLFGSVTGLNMYKHVENQLIGKPIQFTPINTYNTFEINFHRLDGTDKDHDLGHNHICVFSIYTNDIRIRYPGGKRKEFYSHAGCTPNFDAMKVDDGTSKFICSSSNKDYLFARGVHVTLYDDTKVMNDNPMMRDYLRKPINCIIGISGVVHRGIWAFGRKLHMFFDKAFKYSKNETHEGSSVVQVQIIDKKELKKDIQQIKQSNDEDTLKLKINNYWRIPGNLVYFDMLLCMCVCVCVCVCVCTCMWLLCMFL